LTGYNSIHVATRPVEIMFMRFEIREL